MYNLGSVCMILFPIIITFPTGLADCRIHCVGTESERARETDKIKNGDAKGLIIIIS